jgi:hypothetical protein
MQREIECFAWSIKLMPISRGWTPPPCIERFLGTGTVLKRKAPAKRNIGVDLNRACIDNFDYAEAELFCEDAFKFLENFDYLTSGRAISYLDPS